jgi:predicted Rossmann-fold nucleotide-binding protein
MLEIESLEALERWLGRGATPAAAIQGLNLSALTDELLAEQWHDCLLLGCTLEDRAALHVVRSGGLVIPRLEGFAFETHRPRLYSPDELFAGFELGDGTSFERTPDQRIYRQYLEQGGAHPPSILTTLARRLHDHSITDALNEMIRGHRVAAIMGGHGMERRDPEFRAVASISRRLTRLGFLMVSGGGPGAMEATHLGAFLAARDDEALERAIELLSPRPAGAAPGKEYADPDWLARAWRVRDELPIPEAQRNECHSVGIPTWLYGHEPPTPFATHIAKYFANSVREEGLLTIATHGVVYARGSAGTTQEIFQDATQNHYHTTGFASPMILFGVRHWTRTRPVWPLLKAVSEGEPFGKLVALTDSEDEVVETLLRYSPDDHRSP